MIKLFIFGLGHVGKELKSLLPVSSFVGGTSRTANPTNNVITLEDKTLPDFLKKATHLLISIPPVLEHDILFEKYQDLIFSQKQLRWIGYLSSTSVYGNHEGATVTEESTCAPLSEEGRGRLIAERAWQALGERMSVPVTILRLGGIYGPHQNPLLRIKSGVAQKIIANGHVFSRVHLKDIGESLLKILHHPMPGGVFNMVDDLPASQEDVYDYSTQLLSMDPLPAFPLDPKLVSPTIYRYFQEKKRVSNAKLKDHFKIKLYYPTYREGLRSLMETL